MLNFVAEVTPASSHVNVLEQSLVNPLDPPFCNLQRVLADHFLKVGRGFLAEGFCMRRSPDHLRAAVQQDANNCRRNFVYTNRSRYFLYVASEDIHTINILMAQSIFHNSLHMKVHSCSIWGEDTFRVRA